jgi:hypothetical protein
VGTRKYRAGCAARNRAVAVGDAGFLEKCRGVGGCLRSDRRQIDHGVDDGLEDMDQPWGELCFLLVVVAVVMAALLFVLRGKRFAGPPIGDEIARRKAAIAAAEAAVGERA